jgi:hypothetical protein
MSKTVIIILIIDAIAAIAAIIAAVQAIRFAFLATTIASLLTSKSINSAGVGADKESFRINNFPLTLFIGIGANVANTDSTVDLPRVLIFRFTEYIKSTSFSSYVAETCVH